MKEESLKKGLDIAPQKIQKEEVKIELLNEKLKAIEDI